MVISRQKSFAKAFQYELSPRIWLQALIEIEIDWKPWFAIKVFLRETNAAPVIDVLNTSSHTFRTANALMRLILSVLLWLSLYRPCNGTNRHW